LAGAAVLLSNGSAASEAAASKRTGTIAFIRLENGPVFGRLFVVRPDGGGLAKSPALLVITAPPQRPLRSPE
jgi:hypothetical protein